MKIRNKDNHILIVYNINNHKLNLLSKNGKHR